MACKLLFLTFVEPAISNQMMRENSHCVKNDVVENKTASHSNFSRFLLHISASTTPHSPGHHATCGTSSTPPGHWTVQRASQTWCKEGVDGEVWC